MTSHKQEQSKSHHSTHKQNLLCTCFLQRSLKHILVCSFILVTCFSFSQQNKIDSLQNILKNSKNDTTKLTHLNNLGWEFGRIGVYDSALHYAQQALALATFSLSKTRSFDEATNLASKKGIAASCNIIGSVYWSKGDYSKALEYYKKVLKINDELKDKNKIQKTLGKIGNIYREQGDYLKALDHFLNALNINEELGDSVGIANSFHNIGYVYSSQGDYPKALEYYFMALKIHEKLGNKSNIAIQLGNIGVVYAEQAESLELISTSVISDSLYLKVLVYFQKALKLNEELGDKRGCATWLGNIGNVYKDQSEINPNQSQKEFLLNKALDYYLNALKIVEELGDQSECAIWLGNIGSIYSTQKKYKDAEEALLKALLISNKIGNLNTHKYQHKHLSELYEKMGKPTKALEHYKLYIIDKDSLFNEEKDKELTRKAMNYEFAKKEAAAKAEQDKKDIIAIEELKQKEQQRNYFIIGFSLVGILTVFIFKGYRQKQKANVIITQQKDEVSHQKEIVEHQKK